MSNSVASSTIGPAKEDKGLRVRTSSQFKLKDKAGRRFMPIHLLKNFGFVPEVIIIEKVWGYSNTLVVRAVFTEDEIKKEDKAIKNKKKKLEDVVIEKEGE